MLKSEIYDKLNGPGRVRIKLVIKKAQIEDLHLMMLPGGIRYDKDQVQTSPSDPMLRFVEKLSDLEEEMRKLEHAYTKYYEEVESMAGELSDDKMQEVIILHYLAGKKVKDIAELMGYTEGWVRKLEREAIRELEKVVPKNH